MRHGISLLGLVMMLGIVCPTAPAQLSDADEIDFRRDDSRSIPGPPEDPVGLVGIEYCVIADVLLDVDAPEVVLDLPGVFPDFMILRGVTSATVGVADDMHFTFNSDDGPNYTWHYHGSQGYTNACEFGCNTSKDVGSELNRGLVVGDVGNSPNDYSYFALDIVNLPGISKKVMSRDTARGSLGNAIHVANSTWHDPSQIDSMTLRFYNGDIRAGSRFVLLGLDDECAGEPVPLCHCPPGNSDNCKTIYVGPSVAISHLANHDGDELGECP